MRSSPVVSHLFFFNDSLIFFRATQANCQQVAHCLRKYEKAYGQLINFDKSALTFSPSTSSETIDTIKNMLQISVVTGHDVYLGLPTFSIRAKTLQFGFLRDRLLKKVTACQSKLFSRGGREALIKSILQAIPTFMMSCFKLPMSICKQLRNIMAKFWWGEVDGHDAMHWMGGSD